MSVMSSNMCSTVLCSEQVKNHLQLDWVLLLKCRVCSFQAVDQDNFVEHVHKRHLSWGWQQHDFSSENTKLGEAFSDRRVPDTSGCLLNSTLSVNTGPPAGLTWIKVLSVSQKQDHSNKRKKQQEKFRHPRNTNSTDPICLFVCELCLTVFDSFKAYSKHKTLYSNSENLDCFSVEDFFSNGEDPNTVVTAEVENCHADTAVTQSEHAYASIGVVHSEEEPQQNLDVSHPDAVTGDTYSLLSGVETSFSLPQSCVTVQGKEIQTVAEEIVSSSTEHLVTLHSLEAAEDCDVGDTYSSDEDIDSGSSLFPPASDLELLLNATKAHMEGKSKDTNSESKINKKTQKTSGRSEKIFQSSIPLMDNSARELGSPVGAAMACSSTARQVDTMRNRGLPDRHSVGLANSSENFDAVTTLQTVMDTSTETLDGKNQDKHQPEESYTASVLPAHLAEVLEEEDVDPLAEPVEYYRCSRTGCNFGRKTTYFLDRREKAFHEECHIPTGITVPKTQRYRCFMCSFKAKLWQVMKTHIHNQHNVDPGMFKCKLCHYLSPLRGNLRTHMKYTHTTYEKDGDISESLTMKAGLHCEKSKCVYRSRFEFLDVEEKQMHIKLHEDIGTISHFKCPQCSVIMQSWPDMKMHLWKAHEIKCGFHKCKKCNYETLIKSHMVYHEQATCAYSEVRRAKKLKKTKALGATWQENAKSKFHCTVSDECMYAARFSFTDEKEKDSHEKCHKAGTASFQCFVCECVMPDWKTTKRHLMKDHKLNIGMYCCKSCQYKTSRLYFLREHVVLSCKAKTNTCTYKCGAFIKNRAGLKKHLRTCPEKKKSTNGEMIEDIFHCEEDIEASGTDTDNRARLADSLDIARDVVLDDTGMEMSVVETGSTRNDNIINTSSGSRKISYCEFKGCRKRFMVNCSLSRQEKVVHEKSHIKVGLFKCTHCQTMKDNWEHMRIHLWCSHRVDSGLSHCDLCNFYCGRSGELRHHKANFHGKFKNYDQATGTCEYNGKTVYMCTVDATCRRFYYETEKEKVLHERCHGNADGRKCGFYCFMCSYSNGHWKEVQNHLWKEHQVDAGVYTCAHCDYTSTRRSRMEDHVKIHDAAFSYTCIHGCGRQFKTRLQSHAHNMKHCTLLGGEKRNGKPAVCEFCRKQMKTFSALKVHIALKHQNNKVKCPLCSKVLCGQVQLQKHHQNQHLGLKPFKCKYCDFSSSHRTSLDIHHQSHEGNRYQCSVCDYSCKQASIFKKHVLKKHPDSSQVLRCEYCSFVTVGQKFFLDHVRREHNAT